MAAFEYTALDPQGREQHGVIQGDSERQARQNIRNKGLVPVTIKPVAEKKAEGGKKFGIKGKLRVADLALMTRQLATLLSAGLPVEEALRGVIDQTEQARLKSILIEVRSKIMEGFTLAAGLAEFPTIFPELYCATVKAGEESGKLGAVLLRLADYTEEQNAIRQKIKNASIYPALMLIVSISIVIGLMVYIVPNIVGVFADTGQKLPTVTLGLIAVSDIVRSYGIYVIILMVMGIFGWRKLRQNPEIKRWADEKKLKLPLFGRVLRTLNTARFAHTFGILTSSGVPVLEAMRTGAEVMTNEPMREAVLTATSKVREGSTINKALQETHYFSPMMIHLMANGEASGQLAMMLERAATIQDKEVDNLIGSVLSLMEPVIILLMGGVVLLIVMAVLLPIFSLTQGVGT